MSPVRFLVPGTTGQFRCGGLLVELQTAGLVGSLRPTEVVTYRQRERDHPFLADLLRQEPAPGTALWVVSWGFDVPALLRQLRGRPVAYHAHSSGYGFSLAPGVPVLAVSRNTLAYWGEKASRTPLFLVPNALSSKWLERGARPQAASGRGNTARRPIDVLVQRRKNSRYVLEVLVPELRRAGLTVEVQSGWVDDLVDLFNSATVVLYDSADYWRGRGVSEGFGLPPIEALACGCVVFSSFNHALADTLDPGLLGHQIGFGTLAADLERITAAVRQSEAWRADPSRLEALLRECSEPELLERWRHALEGVEAHWHHCLVGNNPPLRALPPWRLRWGQRLGRLQGWLLRRFGSGSLQ
ncbi:MAG: glycosyltransferase family 1 protein [Cyanobacteriota bacterium]|nr:glycosyltransferase family 1 protein [Cyanobacteriota bacterium]